MVATGGVLIIQAVHEEYVDAADWVALSRADEVAERARLGTLPPRLPVVDEGETVVQVVRDGTVVTSSKNLPVTTRLPLPDQPSGDRTVAEVADIAGLGGGPYRTTVVDIRTPDGPATVLVAVSTEDGEDIVESAVRIGSIGLVFLMLPMSLLLWVAVGRTLAPVEAIRERAAVISADHLSERVPEPPVNDEIGRLARTINAMLARLDAAADQQRRFLADAAHELRSPVASLRAQLETALPPGRGPAALNPDDLLADTLRLQAIVDQLLQLARIEDGSGRAVRVPVDLDDTVATVVTARDLEAQGRGVTVDTTEVVPVQVVGDPALLEQVVRNLVDNAVRHAEREVRVSLDAREGMAVLTVDDDGPGIPVEHRTDVFRRFTRLDDARDRDGGGVGLGLAIVADIVAAHGGSVVALSSPAGGARLQVTLPASAVTTGPAPDAPGSMDRGQDVR
ncbi:HAMP domain-containing histidine kinase [Nocardioides sp. WL0053]|uniref:histidine kinase n=2 Tax=Nocardioides jiangsuensis TaxID=2866161 RepID=A0ABS7RMX8_9ACTN|nr:HAMP domain-containing histidine kinase [Nocardioides jiangsuensis]